MKKITKETKFSALKSFCEIAKKLEGSNIIMLHEFMPEFYPKVTFPKDEESCDDLPVFGMGRGRSRSHCEPSLKKSDVKALKSEIEAFAKYFGIGEVEAMLLVAAYTKEMERDSPFDTSDITDFMGLKAIEFMPIKSNFDSLVDNAMFVRVMCGRRKQYKVESSLALAIQSSSPYTRPEKKMIDRYEFCHIVGDLAEDRSEEAMTTRCLFDCVEQLEEQNAGLEFVQNVKKISDKTDERTLFYICCNDFVENRRFHESGLECTLSDIYDSVQKRMKVSSEIISKKHILIHSNMIEKSEGTFVSEVSLSLADKGKAIFLENDLDLYQKQKNNKKLSAPEDIKEKQLFYSADFGKKIDSLTKSLMNENFVKLQERLEKEAMPKGVSVIFYGAPGTGKTETAKQIARQTGRKVYHVDISASKSCWFGESEKLIKRIFTDYREMCENEEKKPILLFNEADALFSKRKDVNSSNVAQTENAIQNIILEELEKLDGILIATTNLADNLDPAFERRFLFKLKFDKPTIEAKKSIWKSKLVWLAEEQCRKLAADYDFSGGEIDNIVRKVVMDEVISGNRPDFDFIVDACKNERFAGGQHTKVGF